MQPCRREIRVNRGGGVGTAKQVPQEEWQNSSIHLDSTCTEDAGAARLLDTDLLEFSGTPDSLGSPTWLQAQNMSCEWCEEPACGSQSWRQVICVDTELSGGCRSLLCIVRNVPAGVEWGNKGIR